MSQQCNERRGVVRYASRRRALYCVTLRSAAYAPTDSGSLLWL